MLLFFFFFKQKTSYEMRISDWSSDVCSSDLLGLLRHRIHHRPAAPRRRLMEQAGFALERRCHIARSPRPDLVQRLGRPPERALLIPPYRPPRARKSPLSGKRASARVALGGRRTTKHHHPHPPHPHPPPPPRPPPPPPPP